MPKFLVAAAPIAVASLAFVSAVPACAQASAAAQVRSFSIPAGRLSQSVLALSEQAGVQVVFDSDTTGSVGGNAVAGNLTLADALDRLLSGTGLSWRWLRSGVVTIESAKVGGERVTGAVRVEGLQGSPYFGGAGQIAGVNGVNGSRDITATEGTKSFTTGALTIGSKVPQAMKDVPQSISVLTSEQLKQQNITDFTSAMQQLPGISLTQGTTSLENTFYSRGFAVTSIQVDGGAPFTTLNGYSPQIDMSVYDHVELVRGANGLFDGYGDPSGTINLVRKKPLDHPQYTLEVLAGSWKNYRLVADASAPLGLDGRLRARLVMTYQDNHHFYNIAKDNKELVYGTAEFDATPTTLLTAGITYTRQNSVPWQNGLPRYITGADLKLPRSTCLCFSWNRWNFNTTEIFGSVEQKIADDWKLKVNLTQNRQSSTQKLGYSNGAVTPLTGTGPQLYGTYSDTASNQLSAEAVLTGAFTILGQRQEITIGANRASSNGGGQTLYNPLISSSSLTSPYQPYPGGPRYCYTTSIAHPCPAGTIGPQTPPINVFDFDPSALIYTEPANSLPYVKVLNSRTVQTGAFVNLRLTAFDRLHLTTGLRWSRYSSGYNLEYLCTTIPTSGILGPGSCFGRNIGDPYRTYVQSFQQSHIDWPPTSSLSFDVTKQLTAYAGYTNIYQSQASQVTSDHKPLPPIRGSNVEAGLKWAPHDGRLNLSLSIYRIKQKGFAMMDPNQPFQDLGLGVFCCFLDDPNYTLISEGADFEATGEILPGWQVAASYNFNRNKQAGSDFGTSAGQPFTTIQPKNLYKLWTSYDFGAAGRGGPFSHLTVSGGINGQSSAYYAGSICVNPIVPPPPPGNGNTCVSFGPPDTVDFNFTVPGHTVASARLDYRLSSKWSFALSVDNLFDKVYYQTVGSSPINGNWYGAPRSFTATLQGKW